jgi:hypothetical protein
LFQTEISGLTRSGRCFTSEELRKAKGKEVVDLDKALEVNKPVVATQFLTHVLINFQKNTKIAKKH